MPRARKQNSFFHDLFEILTMAPAWVGPLLAVLAYVALKYLTPLFFRGDDPMVAAGGSLIVAVATGAAPLVSGLVILLWFAAEIWKRLSRARLDRTHSIDDIRAFSWRDFERLVDEAYRRKGYLVEDVDSPSGDGGVDLILHANGETTLVQCKRWKERQVGVKVVRELFGVMHDRAAARAIIVCVGDFTPEARDFADRNRIELVTGPALVQLIAEVKSPSPSAPRSQSLPPSAHTAPAPAAATPSCPACGAPMVMKTARRGSTAGSRFWGCSHYPQCHGKRNIT